MAANGEATVTLSLIDRITAPIKAIGARLSSLTKSLGIQRITGAVGKLGGSLRGLGDGLAASTGRLSAFLGLLGVGGAGAIASAYGLAKSAADVGAELTEMSGKLGIGVEALQEYRFAAKMSGVEVSAFDKGVEKIGINAVAATKGNKQMAAAFKSLGVNVKGAKGQMRGTEDILDDTMVALSKIKDPLKRNAMAFKLFGKSGVDLVKMLGDGSEGLRELREEARRTGNVMSEDAAAAGDELGDRVDALMERVTGLKNLVGVQLIPVFNEAVKGITEWADANADLIRSTVTEWARGLVGVIKDLINPASELRQRIDGMAESFGTFLTKVRPVVDFLGGPMNTALFAVAAWIVGPIVAAVATLAAAFINLGVVIMSTPFGWILLGVAAVAAAVYVLYQRWDEFVSYFSGAMARVKEAFNEGFIQGVGAILSEFNPVILIAKGIDAVLEYLTGLSFQEEGAALMSSLWDGMKSTDLAQSIVTAVSAAWMAYEEWWNGFSATVRGAGAAIVNALWEGLKSAWADVVSWMKGAVAELIGWLPQAVQERLGFKVTADVETNVDGKKAEPGAGTPSAVNDNVSRVGADVGRMGANLMNSVPTGASETRALAPAGAAAPSGSGTDVNASTVQTQTVQTQSLNVPDPLLVHQPQTINAPLNVGGVVVNVQGMTPAEGQAMVDGAIRKSQARHAASVQSILGD